MWRARERSEQLASEAPPRVPRHVCRVVTHTPAPSGPRPPRPACQPKTQAATAPSAAARSGRRPSPGSASERRRTVRSHARYTREARRASRALRSSLEVFAVATLTLRNIAGSRPVGQSSSRINLSQSQRESGRQGGREGQAGRQRYFSLRAVTVSQLVRWGIWYRHGYRPIPITF